MGFCKHCNEQLDGIIAHAEHRCPMEPRLVKEIKKLNEGDFDKVEINVITKALNVFGFTGLTGTCKGCEKKMMLPEGATVENLFEHYCDECSKIDPRPVIDRDKQEAETKRYFQRRKENEVKKCVSEIIRKREEIEYLEKHIEHTLGVEEWLNNIKNEKK